VEGAGSETDGKAEDYSTKEEEIAALLLIPHLPDLLGQRFGAPLI